jgi:hypothetical protein
MHLLSPLNDILAPLAQPIHWQRLNERRPEQTADVQSEEAHCTDRRLLLRVFLVVERNRILMRLRPTDARLSIFPARGTGFTALGCTAATVHGQLITQERSEWGDEMAVAKWFEAYGLWMPDERIARTCRHLLTVAFALVVCTAAMRLSGPA